ncbi:MAG: hypothetical protein JST68_07250, partial [Bacteroidetes bacterium]|nr:hypothetical protein [Bacteroidota bacterium]
MASKKLTLLFGLLCLFLSYSYGQVGQSYDVRDSSLIPTKRLAQHNEFLNNAYPFPAKPRNEWELGVKGGYTYGFTDVRNWGPTGGFGVHLRKALGYVVSLRLEYDWLRLRGLGYQPTQGYGRNAVLSSYYGDGGVPNAPFLFNNFRSTIHELSLQGVFSLNNINFHKAKTSWNAYIFGGPGLATYSTFYKTVDGSGAAYNYSDIITKYGGNFSRSNRKDVLSDLKNKLSGDWSTMADRSNTSGTLGGAPLTFVGVVGLGFEFKLNNRWNIAIEDKFTFTSSDLIDGQQWQNNYAPVAVQSIAQTRSADSYNFLSVGVNYNIFPQKHAVEPLWWLNPLDYAYNEINAPRHMKLPKPVLDDADG